MKKLNKFSVHGTAVGESTEIRLDEISILADSETIKNIGVFLINAAYEMEVNGLEHMHLQDFFKDFTSEDHVDFVAINSEMIHMLSDKNK